MNKMLGSVYPWLMGIYKYIGSRFGVYFLKHNWLSVHIWRMVYPTPRKLTEQIKKERYVSREYFAENSERVIRVASFFVDDLSKDVYLKMINFRSIGDISDFPQYDIKTQYFHNEYFEFGDDEVFVDCGAYIGDTVLSFKKIMKKVDGKVKRIVAFEPDEDNYKYLKRGHKDINCINAGVWNCDDTLHFAATGNSASSLGSGEAGLHNLRGGILIPVRAIDNVPESEGVTLLKMDVEGAELLALKGAYNTIKKYKPRLAISIYHSDEDMITIPEWIHDNFPEYKLFVRQHEYGFGETVLYGFV